MVNDCEEITIYNLRYDSATRRETTIATVISGVSFYVVVGTTTSGMAGSADTSENIQYKIRIPITANVQDGREYIGEQDYKALSDDEVDEYWTIQKGCQVLGYDGLLITVTEYADNTRRGTDAVKHWRIGGA